MAQVQSQPQQPQLDGHASYGANITDALLQEEKIEHESVSKLSKEHDLVLKTFRVLIADLCSQYNAGHPGGAMGMAAIGVALWKYVMRYSPKHHNWFNRDRFVLSNGHTCLFQYSFLHFAGYPAFNFDMLKTYHSERPESLCPGHPEIEADGIEVTTGPLGQGLANAVGLAVATKQLAAQYNQPGFDVVNNHTWCMMGDACPQEGIGQESISLAGHWRLNNLTVIYDNNQITCDGSVDMTNNEDINARFRAANWDVIDVYDGCFNVDGIVAALKQAKASKDKPTLVNIRTIIGVGSAVAGQAVSHGVPFKPDDVQQMKKAYGFDPDKTFNVPQEMYDFFSDIPARGEKNVQEWDKLIGEYKRAHPKLAMEFESRVRGELPANWEDLIPKEFPSEPTASRKSSGLAFNPISEVTKSIMVGTADLSPSVNLLYGGKVDFQSPELSTACGINGNYSGRYIHYGVREFAMCAISNGLAAFNPGTILPITSSFFMFYSYAANAVRMGALQHLQVIHLATHDSIGMGEDGPTHQPVELAAYFRAMPNLLYFRPGDSEEVAGAWATAIKCKTGPSIISTSRHNLPQHKTTKRAMVSKGAYVLEENTEADITLIGVGAELSFAVDVAASLRDKHGLKTRVVSFPCNRLFEQQPLSYRREVLRRHEGIPAVVIEPYVSYGWAQYTDAMVCMKGFGHSLTGKYVYGHFGFTIESMTERINGYVGRRREDKALEREFTEL